MNKAVFSTLIALIAAIIMAPAMAPTPASAADLGQPAGNVILTVSGNIEETNNGHVADFDRAMLQDLPQHVVTMETPWTEGEVSFQGFHIRSLLERVGADGREAIATALNDYSASIPMDDLMDRDVMIAMTMNGEPMRVRDKGPLWVIYPTDPRTGELSVIDRDRMVWQLRRLTIQ